MTAFPGWIARETPDGLRTRLEELDSAILDDRDTTLRVHYSSINYKDALALHGRPGVLRRHPLVTGIDVTGEVLTSRHPRWSRGDLVTLNGAGLGEERHGGLAGLAAVDGADLVPVPEPFTPARAAAIGTAGFTAALSLLALRRHGLTPADGPVLVTGAGGGVGSVAVALLAASGHEVIAATGRPDALRGRLTRLGAAHIVGRAELDTGGKPLAAQRWAGVIDAVGGHLLAGALAGLRHSGTATTCGLAASATFPGNVMPFILRGVSLVGIDSVRTTPARRAAAWQLLARHLDPRLLDSVTRSVPLSAARDAATEVLAGHGTGRTVVDVRAH
ncbi:acryloyl-CoA reductase [Streptomyces albus]|uniref:Acryloyl-CoA reductase n=1 Tax=Streptomyces albus TaxID=1888 RepID=A0A8H1LL31_9ACTN|nr:MULTISPECIES: acryloyl-CoA reductase [Streptomyces]MDI6410606.1 acryloyl-CoA reductase [Streptomyces albus]TGG84650.1 acryloyl-CoA reductase [Streptomyces albus]UVN56299.1 acryloyl-CoA reductase [Streptomyces albus]